MCFIKICGLVIVMGVNLNRFRSLSYKPCNLKTYISVRQFKSLNLRMEIEMIAVSSS